VSDDALLVFPARSVASTEIELDPWPSTIVQAKVEPETLAGALLQEALATPDRASLAVPLTVIEGVLRLMVCPFGGD
jgi:hypothetical protein